VGFLFITLFNICKPNKQTTKPNNKIKQRNSRAKVSQLPSSSSSQLPPSPSPAESSAVSPAPASLSDESSKESGPNANSVSGLQGMGIAVVLKNRNHIRTIEDKSADHIEREESRKQLGEEQRRKEHHRTLRSLEHRSRRHLVHKDQHARHEKNEAARKNHEEERVKKAAREETEKTERRDTEQRKQKADFERQEEEDNKRQEQHTKEGAKKTRKVEEHGEKKRENERLGVIFKEISRPSQGRVIKPASEIQFTGQYTYMLWLRIEKANGAWTNIFHKGSADGTRNPGMWIYPGRSALHVRSGSNSNWNNGCDVTEDLPIGEWTHLVLTHDGQGIRVFRNRKVVCESNYGAPLQNEGPLYFSDPWYQAANVEVADFRMVPRIVTEEEIDKAVRERRGLKKEKKR